MPTVIKIGMTIGGGFEGAAFDSDYQAVLNYATTQGYTLPSTGQQTLQNQLVVDLKAGGIWSKLDTFGVFATDGDSDFALIDWIRLTDYTAVNSPTFTTDEGFTGNGTSSYINTNFNPATQGVNYTRINASRYYMHFSGSSTVVDGVQGSSVYNSIRINSSTVNNCINSASTLSSNFLFVATIGVKSIHRTSATDVSLYNDKTVSNRTQSDEALRSENQLILRRGANYSNNTTFGYAMGASLVAENNDFVDAVTNYINSI